MDFNEKDDDNLFVRSGLKMGDVNKIYNQTISSKQEISYSEISLAKNLFQNLITHCFRRVKSNNHILTTENINRYTSRPVMYPKLWDMYKKANASFWSVEEIQMKDDPMHWKNLSDNEQYFLAHILAFFAVSDGVVIDNLVTRFLSEVQIMEARSFYSYQVYVESIHADAYGLMIENLISDKKERDKLFRSLQTFPCIKKKVDWAIKWMDSATSDLSEVTLAFAALEGIFFSGAFASIFWLKKRGLFPGLTFANELIARDEGLHRDFACLLFKESLITFPGRERVLDIITGAVKIEQEFLTQVLPVNLIGINCKMMKDYIEFVADKLLEELNMEKHYFTINPFDFMENISLFNKTNFFERREAEYQRPGVMTETDNDFDFNCSF